MDLIETAKHLNLLLITSILEPKSDMPDAAVVSAGLQLIRWCGSRLHSFR
jgi:hypothetical protein